LIKDINLEKNNYSLENEIQISEHRTLDHLNNILDTSNNRFIEEFTGFFDNTEIQFQNGPMNETPQAPW
jgi:hypothetical protein